MIKCPHCGAEYLPEEIFVDDDFKRRVTNITKDEQGKIIFYSGDSLINSKIYEEYYCDYCNKKFKVSATLNFSTTEDDFDEEYTINLW